MKIVHITPHLGGGVGTVVINWLLEDIPVTGNEHVILSLDVDKNEINPALTVLQGMHKDIPGVFNHVATADVVLIHWWNHPMLFDLMVNYPWPACRLAIWNHVSCTHPPYIHSTKLISFSDRFIFTSPVSYEAREIVQLPDTESAKLDCIWSSCGTKMFDGFTRSQRPEGDTFNIGFTGTVDYGKLHPDFARMCSKIDIENARFIICSGDDQSVLAEDVARLGISDRFNFMGRVPSILPYLAIFDVFGYPLQPKHFGTCEQAIGEAMIAGAVPIVMNNPAEHFIVYDGITGLIAKSEDHYAQCIEFLYEDKEARAKMAKSAGEFARERYAIEKVIRQWNDVFALLMDSTKRARAWTPDPRYPSLSVGARTFAESLGDYGNVFYSYALAYDQGQSTDVTFAADAIRKLFASNTQWQSNNKGGVLQYARTFPDDPLVTEWTGLLPSRNQA